MRRELVVAFGLSACLAIAASCRTSEVDADPRPTSRSTGAEATSEEPRTQVGGSAAADRTPAWESLFDGATLAGWRGYRRGDVPDGWRVEDGAITRVGAGGDLVTERTFENFVLEFEWKLAPGGNSGVFYGVTEEHPHAWESGAEYQILDDDAHADGLDPRTSAAANYALHAPVGGSLRPPGEWNRGRIEVLGDRVRHGLNGTVVVEFTRFDPAWEQLVAASKFGDMPAYGRARRGRIALQDHGDPVAYRGLRILDLGSATTVPAIER